MGKNKVKAETPTTTNKDTTNDEEKEVKTEEKVAEKIAQVFVSGIPYDCDEDKLKEFFKGIAGNIV